MRPVREYLEAEVAVRERIGRSARWHYSCPADLVLREGREMEPAPYDESWGARGLPRQCFFNAWMLSERHEQLRYVEGYACGVIAVNHAWCIDEAGRIVDPTWTGEDDRPEQRDYFGIVFPTAYVSDHPRLGLIDNWEDDWPLLHRPIAETFEEVPA